MKTIAAIFVPALVGLLIGGGFGYFRGQPFGADGGKLAGACEAADAAVVAKVITPEQAEKLGSALAAKVDVQGARTYTKDNSSAGDGCRRVFTGIVQAAK